MKKKRRHAHYSTSSVFRYKSFIIEQNEKRKMKTSEEFVFQRKKIFYIY